MALAPLVSSKPAQVVTTMPAMDTMLLLVLLLDLPPIGSPRAVEQQLLGPRVEEVVVAAVAITEAVEATTLTVVALHPGPLVEEVAVTTLSVQEAPLPGLLAVVAAVVATNKRTTTMEASKMAATAMVVMADNLVAMAEATTTVATIKAAMVSKMVAMEVLLVVTSLRLRLPPLDLSHHLLHLPRRLCRHHLLPHLRLLAPRHHLQLDWSQQNKLFGSWRPSACTPN